MLRHIAALWGIKNTDTLDPLVKLLVEALAGELKKTHNEIQTFEKRILEKIALLLTPGVLSFPYPAHAICKALPTESIHTIDRKTQLQIISKAIAGQDKPLTLHFTPAGPVRIFNAEITNMATDNKFFSIASSGHKTPLFHLSTSNTHSKNIWLGLKISPDIKQLNGLNFFIDFKNTDARSALLQMIHSASWYIHHLPVKITHGLSYEYSAQKQNIISDYEPLTVIENEVTHLYNDHFVTIHSLDTSLPLAQLTEEIPAELAKYAEAVSTENKLLWLRLELPGYVDDRVINDLQITCNSFPIINRKLTDKAHRLKGITNIIPIHTDTGAFFLSVEQLSDSEGRTYTQTPFMTDEEKDTGTFAVRHGGTERPDTRNAKEYLVYLMDLIRDESAAFSSYGQETISSMVKELDRILAQLEQRLRKNPAWHEDSSHYVTVGYRKNQEAFFMQYWITNSTYANGINAGTPLNLYMGSELRNGSIELLTSTTGGKKALEPSRHIDAYKYAMLSHNKIITAEDIKAFCYYELGNLIDMVTVRKGLTLSKKPGEGLIRCIEIRLRKHRKNISDQETAIQWENMLANLKTKMELRSSLNLNFEIKLEE